MTMALGRWLSAFILNKLIECIILMAPPLMEILDIPYTALVWEIEGTDAFRAWYETLEEPEWSAVNVAVDALARVGPGLRRPRVGHITGSRLANMRELVVPYRNRNLRVLFAFDPRRTAILLLGGDKTDRWEEWYEENVPRADDLYDTYLTELKKEGLI